MTPRSRRSSRRHGHRLGVRQPRGREDAAPAGLANAPFASDNLPVILEVMNELNETVRRSGPSGTRTTMVFLARPAWTPIIGWTKFPVKPWRISRARRSPAPGVLGTWLRAPARQPVDGSLTSYYTDIQTRRSRGRVDRDGILPAKVYEVAPYITRRTWAPYNGGMAINKDTWNKLPREIQRIMKDVGKEYR